MGVAINPIPNKPYNGHTLYRADGVIISYKFHQNLFENEGSATDTRSRTPGQNHVITRSEINQ